MINLDYFAWVIGLDFDDFLPCWGSDFPPFPEGETDFALILYLGGTPKYY